MLRIQLDNCKKCCLLYQHCQLAGVLGCVAMFLLVTGVVNGDSAVHCCYVVVVVGCLWLVKLCRIAATCINSITRCIGSGVPKNGLFLDTATYSSRTIWYGM